MGNLVLPRHLLTILLSLTAGVGIGYLSEGEFLGFIPLGLALSVYFLLLTLSKRPSVALRLSNLHYIWISLLFVGLGMITEEIHRPARFESLPAAGSVAAAEILERASLSSSDHLLVEIREIVTPSGERVYPGGVKMMLSVDATDLSVGDKIQFPLDPDPVVDDSNIRESYYARNLRSKGIFYTQYLENSETTLLGHNKSLSVYFTECRDRLEIFIDKSGLRRTTASFVNTVLLGDKAYLSNEARQQYSSVGIAHILAVSGMHVGIIASIIFLLTFPMNFSGLYRWRYLLVIPLVWGFTLLTGASVSAVRASVMLTFTFMAVFLERPGNVLSALSWAAFFIILFSPSAIFDVGFLLSFLCVASLVVFVEPLNTVDHRSHPRLYRLNSLLLVSLVATASSWALISYCFGRLPLAFMPANIVIVPLIPLYVGGVLIHLALSFISHSPAWLIDSLDWLHELFERFVGYLAENSASVELTVGFPTLLLWIAFLIVAAIALREWKSLRGGGYALVMFAVAVGSVPFFLPERTPDGLIIRDSFPSIMAVGYRADEEKEISLPRGGVSAVTLVGNRILCVDSPDLPDGASIESHRPGIVIVGGGFSSDLSFLDSIIGSKKPLYVFHSSLRKVREKDLIREADSLGVRHHSLRLHGPLRLFP